MFRQILNTREDLVEINPATKAESAKYFLKVHHDFSIYKGKVQNSIGHFYVELVDNITRESKFFGKHPATTGVPIYTGAIKSDDDRLAEAIAYDAEHDRKVLTTKVIPLTKSQYDKAMTAASAAKEDPGMYVVGFSDCISFTQKVYSSAKLPRNFTDIYTKEELLNLGSLASQSSFLRLKASDVSFITYGVSEVDVAQRYNVSPQRVIGGVDILSDADAPVSVNSMFMILNEGALRPFQRLKAVSDEIHRFIKPFAQKLNNGYRLEDSELEEAFEVVSKYYDTIERFGDTNFNVGFVRNKGAIGKIANEMLHIKCLLTYGHENTQKCNYAKILLANYEASHRATYGSIDDITAHNMRLMSYEKVGFSRTDDLIEATNLAAGRSINFNPTLMDLFSGMKASYSFHEDLEGIISLIPESMPSEGISSLLFLQSSVANILMPEGNVHNPKFFAPSKDEAASILRINPENIKAKYASDAFSREDHRATSLGNGNIYEISIQGLINPNHGTQTSAIYPPDPEFLTRFVTSTINVGITPDGDILSGVCLPTASGASKPSILCVNIDPDFIELRRHQKETGELDNLWRDGVASYGGFHEVRMVPSILNGNGADSVRPSHMVTGGWRPGAKELSSFSTDSDLFASLKCDPRKSMAPSPFGSAICSPAVTDTCSTVFSNVANLSRTFMGSHEQLNVDPIVIDLAGKGIKLTNWKTNQVLFDIDGDGYLEQTGWIDVRLNIKKVSNISSEAHK